MSENRQFKHIKQTKREVPVDDGNKAAKGQVDARSIAINDVAEHIRTHSAYVDVDESYNRAIDALDLAKTFHTIKPNDIADWAVRVVIKLGFIDNYVIDTFLSQLTLGQLRNLYRILILADIVDDESGQVNSKLHFIDDLSKDQQAIVDKYSITLAGGDSDDYHAAQDKLLSAMRRYKTSGEKIPPLTVNVYKVGETVLHNDLPKPVDDPDSEVTLMNAMGEFIASTSNPAIIKLVDGSNKTVNMTDVMLVMQIYNTRDSEYHYSSRLDYETFHTIVTKAMISAGFMVDFMHVMCNVSGIDTLRMDVFKYILTNWNWISAIYSRESIYAVADEYGACSLYDSAIEEEAIRHAYIEKALELEVSDSNKSIVLRTETFITNRRNNQYRAEGVTPRSILEDGPIVFTRPDHTYKPLNLNL